MNDRELQKFRNWTLETLYCAHSLSAYVLTQHTKKQINSYYCIRLIFSYTLHVAQYNNHITNNLTGIQNNNVNKQHTCGYNNVERHPAALVSTCHMALRVSLTKVPSSALVLCFLCFFSVSFLQLAMHFKSVKPRKHISKQANPAMQEQNYLKP